MASSSQIERWNLTETPEQRLVSSFHYVITKIVEDRPAEPPVQRTALSFLAASLSAFLDNVSADLASFSSHAKRKTVSEDDILLCARNNPDLLNKLKTFRDFVAQQEELSGGKRKKRRSKQ